jgi:hypothetical protein
MLFPRPVADERPISGCSEYKKRLGDGLPPWLVHGLRRMFGTTLADMEVEPHIIEKLLTTDGRHQNQADSIVSADAEVCILAKYMPKMRPQSRANGSRFPCPALRMRAFC